MTPPRSRELEPKALEAATKEFQNLRSGTEFVGRLSWAISAYLDALTDQPPELERAWDERNKFAIALRDLVSYAENAPVDSPLWERTHGADWQANIDRANEMLERTAQGLPLHGGEREPGPSEDLHEASAGALSPDRGAPQGEEPAT